MAAGPAVLAVLVGITAGCGGGGGKGDGSSDGRLSVVAAFYPVAEAVARVGGDRVDVTNLTPAGAEPHELELTPDQVDRIQDADLVFVMGHGFQPAVEAAAGDRDGATIELLDELPISAGDQEVADEEGSGDVATLDPHVWLDPVLYSRMVDAIADRLAKADATDADRYAARARRLQDEIESVNQEYTRILADCDRRTIVTAHDAFGWLAARYDLTQQGIAGLSPDAEPTPKRLAELADLVEEQGITTIFTEELVSPRVAETLAREAGGVRTAVLDTLEGLTDEEIAHGDDWASVMRSNLRELEAALGCT